jgi:hypothetical protein
MRSIVRSGAFALFALFCALFFSGCIAPFSPNNSGIDFINGKPYAIPYSVRFWSATQDGRNVEFLYRVCGDPNKILYIESKTYQELSKKDGGVTVDSVKPYFASRLAGCISSMSEQELQYRMHRQGLQTQQNIADQQARQQFYQNVQQSGQQLQQNLQMIQLNNNLQRLYNQRVWGF